MCNELQDICIDLSEKPYLASVDELMREPGVQDPSETVSLRNVSQSIVAEQTEGETEVDLNIQAEHKSDILRFAEVEATLVPDVEAEHSPRNTSEHGSAQGERDDEGRVSPTVVDMEIERLRRHEGNVGTSMIPEFTPANAVLLSPTRGDEMPAASGGSFRSGQEECISFGPGLFPTPNLASSTETLGQEPELATTYEPHQIQQPSFSDVPELIKSPGTDVCSCSANNFSFFDLIKFNSC